MDYGFRCWCVGSVSLRRPTWAEEAHTSTSRGTQVGFAWVCSYSALSARVFCMEYVTMWGGATPRLTHECANEVGRLVGSFVLHAHCSCYGGLRVCVGPPIIGDEARWKFLKIPVLCTDKISKFSPKMFGLEQACTEKVKICSDCPSGPQKCQICSD